MSSKNVTLSTHTFAYEGDEVHEGFVLFDGEGWWFALECDNIVYYTEVEPDPSESYWDMVNTGFDGFDYPDLIETADDLLLAVDSYSREASDLKGGD